MKILLVNPEVPNTFWSLKNALKFVSKKALLPPLGLLTVASMLPESFEKRVVDMNVTALLDRDIKWADYVFVTGMVIQKKSVDQIIERCKKLNARIVAGGPLFTVFPGGYLNVDHLVLKEAEITLPAFLSDLEKGHPEPFYTTREKPDLKNTPVPQWDLINMKKYALMCIQYSRGCPFNCDFCDITALLGHKVRTKTTSQIIDELETLYVHKWRGDVFLVDDNFIGKRQELKNELLPAITNWMNKRNHPFSFNTQVSIDMVDDEELMSMMAGAGFSSVFIGIESPNELSLTECSKTQNTGRDIVAAVKKIQQFGMQVQAGFILGFDNDKPNVFDKLISLIQESGVVTAMVGLLNAPPGTKLYKKLMSENRLTMPASGDNMDCTINFIPRMDIHELMRGYHKVLNTIYSQKYYCKRIKTFLKNYNFRDKAKLKLRFSDIMAFLRANWRIGIIEKGKMYYWMLLFWAIRSPRRFMLAVRLSIYGFHFRKMLQNIQNHMEILAEKSANEYKPAASEHRLLTDKLI
jgi:radical SAM superfamily enzyme YgiQ (UPF0313 family)